MNDHLFIIATLYFLFAIISGYRVIKSIRLQKRITIMNICETMFVLVLVVVPALDHIAFIFDGRSFNASYTIEHIWSFYVALFATIIGYISIQFGYHIKQKDVLTKHNSPASKPLTISTVLIIISLVALSLWASGFGGITKLIINANSIRAGFIDSVSNLAFFKHFVPLSMLASFVVFDFLFLNKAFSSFIQVLYAWVLLFVSVAVSIVYIIGNDGRMLAGVYLFLFAVLKLRHDFEHKNKKLSSIIIRVSVLAGLAFVLILYSDALFRQIKGVELSQYSYESDYSVFKSITSEFSFVSTSTQRAILLQSETTPVYMFINDVVNGLFAWFPTSAKPINLTDVWDYNTALINPGGYGQTPTSIIAQSIYDLGFIGLIIIPGFYGYLIKKIEKHLNAIPDQFFSNIVFVVLGFYLGKGLIYFSFYNIMLNIFFVVFGVFVCFIIRRITFYDMKHIVGN